MDAYTACEVISTPGALANLVPTWTDAQCAAVARQLMDHVADNAPEPVTYDCTVEEVTAEIIARRDGLRTYYATYDAAVTDPETGRRRAARIESRYFAFDPQREYDVSGDEDPLQEVARWAVWCETPEWLMESGEAGIDDTTAPDSVAIHEVTSTEADDVVTAEDILFVAGGNGYSHFGNGEPDGLTWLSEVVEIASRDHGRAAKAATKAREALASEVRCAVAAGMSQSAAARAAGVDRMTVRKWLGLR